MNDMDATPTLRGFLDAWDLFGDPTVTGMLAGALLGYLGVFIVLRRMVFVSAAISQSAALGVSLTFMAESYGLFVGGHAEHVLGALLLALLTMGFFILNPERIRVTREGVLGLAYLVGASGALLVGSRITQEAHEINAVLFGPGVVVEPVDYQLTIAATVGLLAAHALLRRGLVFACFDEDSARVQQLPVRALNLFLFLSIGIAVAVTTHAVGALSVFAFSVLPAVAALATSNRMGLVMLMAPLVGLVCGGGGYVLAYLYQFPVGAAQSMLACLVCVLAMTVAAFRPSA